MLKPLINLTKNKKNSIQTVTTKIWLGIQSRTEDCCFAYRSQQMYVVEVANYYECVDECVRFVGCFLYVKEYLTVLLRTLRTTAVMFGL